MLGQPMQVRVNGSLTVKLAPFSKDDAQQLITNGNGGMQLHSVTRYMSSRRAFTAEDERDWYDRIAADSKKWHWGIWITEGDESKLIGGSTLFDLEEFPFRQATSGSAIIDKAYWGKGIMSANHKARTWYAFNQLGMVRVKSAVLLPNIGSRKALERSGYFHHSIERNVQFTDGAYLHQENLECLNPHERFWSLWWGDDKPSKEAILARKVTQEALEWADANVTLL